MSQAESAPQADTASAPAEGASTYESLDDITSALERMEEPESDDSDAPETVSNDAAQGLDEVDADNNTEADTEAGDQPQQEETASVEAPASWTAEEKAFFQTLPPEAQQTIARRESEREKFVNAKAQEATEARNIAGQAVAFIEEKLAERMQLAALAIEGEFAGIDWRGLKTESPEMFLKLQGLLEQRMEGLAQLDADRKAVCQHMAQQQAQAEGERLKGEFANVMPRIKDIVGNDFEPGKYKKDVSDYLTSLGAPQEHINGITHGYMLEMATKAMLFDRGAKAREAAAQKVAAAPVVQKTKGRGRPDLEGAAKARNIIQRNAGSNDAIAEGLAALGF